MHRSTLRFVAVIAACCLAGRGPGRCGADPTAVDLQKVLFQLPPGPPLRDSVGADVAGAGDSLVCRIEPLCSHVWLGERPRFRVRIANRSRRTVLLVTPVHGCVWRQYPRGGFDYEGPPGGAVGSDHLSLHEDSLQAGDFLPLAPGKQLDLFGSGGYVDARTWFTRPGRYVARFTYSTAENDLRWWLGSFQPDSLAAPWHARFRHVPRVELHAECAFEVQQR